MVVSGTRDLLMIEGEMDEISEIEMLEAIKALSPIAKLCDFQDELRNELGKEKREFISAKADETVEDEVKA